MAEKKENRIIQRWRTLKVSVSNFIYHSLNWKWKYLLWLICLMVNEYNLEFSRLTQEDQERIIAKHVAIHGEDIEAAKRRNETEQQLINISDFISNQTEANQSKKAETTRMIEELSNFVDLSVGKGYKEGLAEIRSIRIFQADVYYITDSFLTLLIFLFLSYDGDRYTYIHDNDRIFMYGLSRFAFKAAIIWGLNDFISNIFTSAERFIKNEVLIAMISLYVIFIVAAIWEDVKRAIEKRKQTAT